MNFLEIKDSDRGTGLFKIIQVNLLELLSNPAMQYQQDDTRRSKT